MRQYSALPRLKLVMNQRTWFCPPFSFIGLGSSRNFSFEKGKVEAQVILTDGRVCELGIGKSLVYVIHSISESSENASIIIDN